MSDDDIFDPDEYTPGEGGGKKYVDLETPGEYLLGIRAAVKHETTLNDKRYTRFAFVVIDGEHKGESFTDRIFRAATSRGRLAQFCKACRVTKADELRPSRDQDMERVFLGRGLRASVKVNEKGYAELGWPEVCSEGDAKTIDAWSKSFKERAKAELDKAADFDDAPLDQFPSDDWGDDDDVPF